mgnify:CR=1 FL=1
MGMFSGNKHPITEFYERGDIDMGSQTEQLKKIERRNMQKYIMKKK